MLGRRVKMDKGTKRRGGGRRRGREDVVLTPLLFSKVPPFAACSLKPTLALLPPSSSTSAPEMTQLAAKMVRPPTDKPQSDDNEGIATVGDKKKRRPVPPCPFPSSSSSSWSSSLSSAPFAPSMSVMASPAAATPAISAPSCQVKGCAADLAAAKRYHRRHKVCEAHFKAAVVLVAGLRQRFCQQCSRFHELSEFDETKRSCRRRLAGHNERRRKSAAESQGEDSGHCQTSDHGSERMRIAVSANATFKHFQIR